MRIPRQTGSEGQQCKNKNNQYGTVASMILVRPVFLQAQWDTLKQGPGGGDGRRMHTGPMISPPGSHLLGRSRDKVIILLAENLYSLSHRGTVL